MAFPPPPPLSPELATSRLVVFILAYVALAFPSLTGIRLSRASIAVAGATAMLVVGRLPISEAYAAIDFDVLAFLFGVLVVVAYLELAGAFEWAATHVVRHVSGSPRVLLAALIIVAGIASAFFINDTICLALTPLVVATVRPLRLNYVPFLLAVALAANVGGAMAITGNPQNMVIGLASHIPYGAFLVSLALPSLGGLLIVYLVLLLVFRRDLRIPAAPPESITAQPLNRWLATLSVIVFCGMVGCWLAGRSLPLVSLAGAAVLLVAGQVTTSVRPVSADTAGRYLAPVLERLDWSLLLFFGGLFVIVGGVRDVPFVQRGTDVAIHALNGTPWHDAGVVSGAMLVLSNIVSNVPAVLLWRPVIPALHNARFLWLVLAMSSTFAGNLTLLGSVANLIVAERAAAEGVTLSFSDYLKAGIPITLLTIGWGILALTLVAS